MRVTGVRDNWAIPGLLHEGDEEWDVPETGNASRRAELFLAPAFQPDMDRAWRSPARRSRTGGGLSAKNGTPRIERRVTQLFLDTQQLVVFGQTVGARQRAGLDLPAVRRHRQIGNGAVFRLAGTMAHHRLVGGAV